MPPLPKFFITHAWRDIDFTRRLDYDLHANGLDGFFDARSIKVGENLPEKIQQGLEECDIYLPVLSHAAFESPWCKVEINLAIILSNDRARNGRPSIIPVLIDDCAVELKKTAPILTMGKYLTLEDGYENLLYRLLTEGFGVQQPSLPPKTPPPAPAPSAPAPAASGATPPAALPPAKPAEAAPLQAQPGAEPKASTPSKPLAPDDLIHLYDDGRASQNAGDLRQARDAFRIVVEGAPEYRDAALRFKKLELYLQAEDLMQQGLADKEGKPEAWTEAAARLDELLQLDPGFLDVQAKLATAKRWLLLPELYGRLQDALEKHDWANAFALFEQIGSVKADYRKTQVLLVKALPQIVQAGAAKKVGKDEKEMMLIPAGEFLMGSDEAEDEKPPHKVYLDAFHIDRYPVTNAEYKKFVDATKHGVPEHWEKGQVPAGKENHPVVNVSWHDAIAYAQWAGGRLPTEAEWEKAARGTDGRRYPWGNEFDSGKCNTQESGIGDTTPVGKYSPRGDSPYGVGDMAGNVWEWCADWYGANYYQHTPAENPKGPDSGEYPVVRGGSWYLSANDARCANRGGDHPDDRDYDLGFRIAESTLPAVDSAS